MGDPNKDREAGKGDTPRPSSVPEKVRKENWDRIFGVKPKKPKYIPPPLKPETPF